LPQWALVVTACADVGLLFGLTVAFSAPQYYGRVLIFAFLALHLTAFYLGQRPAAFGFASTLIGYTLLVWRGIASGAPLVWREEMWSMAAFAVAGTVLLVEQRTLRRRLERIAGLFQRAEDGDFSDSYEEFADARPDAITHVGRAYNRVRGQLHSLVLTDPLTGCVNRRGFDQALAREVARTSRAGSELALLALDIDHFKSVNDTMGHLAGDLALREVGGLLLRAARTGDVVARTGGEEFCLVLPDTTAAGAYQLAQRLCESIRAHEFRSGDHRIRLTVSVGVVSHVSAHAPARDLSETLKARADEALYGAKRSGRDCVRAWSAKP
jgi:diguanylate cyclase (GGDEF)-like protein